MNSVVKITKYLLQINFIISAGIFVLDIAATAFHENRNDQVCGAQRCGWGLSWKFHILTILIMIYTLLNAYNSQIKNMLSNKKRWFDCWYARSISMLTLTLHINNGFFITVTIRCFLLSVTFIQSQQRLLSQFLVPQQSQLIKTQWLNL